jgi:hypothetical protein
MSSAACHPKTVPTDPDKSDPTITSESPQYPTLIELFRMPAWQHRAKDLFFRTVPVGAGLLASIVVGYVAPDHATRDFFDIAAALIPVLFIALFPVGVFSARSKPLPSMVQHTRGPAVSRNQSRTQAGPPDHPMDYCAICGVRGWPVGGRGVVVGPSRARHSQVC